MEIYYINNKKNKMVINVNCGDSNGGGGVMMRGSQIAGPKFNKCMD